MKYPDVPSVAPILRLALQIHHKRNRSVDHSLHRTVSKSRPVLRKLALYLEEESPPASTSTSTRHDVRVPEDSDLVPNKRGDARDSQRTSDDDDRRSGVGDPDSCEDDVGTDVLGENPLLPVLPDFVTEFLQHYSRRNHIDDSRRDIVLEDMSILPRDNRNRNININEGDPLLNGDGWEIGRGTSIAEAHPVYSRPVGYNRSGHTNQTDHELDDGSSNTSTSSNSSGQKKAFVVGEADKDTASIADRCFPR